MLLLLYNYGQSSHFFNEDDCPNDVFFDYLILIAGSLAYSRSR